MVLFITIYYKLPQWYCMDIYWHLLQGATCRCLLGPVLHYVTWIHNLEICPAPILPLESTWLTWSLPTYCWHTEGWSKYAVIKTDYPHIDAVNRQGNWLCYFFWFLEQPDCARVDWCGWHDDVWCTTFSNFWAIGWSNFIKH